MGSSLLRRLLAVSVILVVPAVAFAQEAALTGTVTDATMAVLPGVTIKAVHAASGNTFEAVTDQRGAYRIPVRVGVYKITRELSGFNTVTRDGVEMLVGQTTTINLQMAPAAWPRSMTVTGAGAAHRNHDVEPRLATSIRGRCTELPSQGRNWMSLALLAPGNRTNAQGATAGAGPRRRPRIPAQRRRPAGDVEPGHREPVPLQQRRDRRVPVHLEPVRRDAGPLVGRAGERHHQVGHQQLAGIVRRQLPRQRLERGGSGAQQGRCRTRTSRSAGPIGGPIMQNKLHFFANYEYEHQPLTSIWTDAVSRRSTSSCERHPRRQAGAASGSTRN